MRAGVISSTVAYACPRVEPRGENACVGTYEARAAENVDERPHILRRRSIHAQPKRPDDEQKLEDAPRAQIRACVVTRPGSLAEPAGDEHEDRCTARIGTEQAEVPPGQVRPILCSAVRSVGSKLGSRRHGEKIPPALPGPPII
jgi:hypothetical protein